MVVGVGPDPISGPISELVRHSVLLLKSFWHCQFHSSVLASVFCLLPSLLFLDERVPTTLGNGSWRRRSGRPGWWQGRWPDCWSTTTAVTWFGSVHYKLNPFPFTPPSSSPFFSIFAQNETQHPISSSPFSAFSSIS